jgi:DNA-directed RNA polymerase specialized sigma24 family protein
MQALRTFVEAGCLEPNAAYPALYQQFASTFWDTASWFTRGLPDREIAREDMYQDIWVDVLERWPRINLDNICTPTHWRNSIRCLGRNKAIDYLRRRGREPAFSLDAFKEATDFDYADPYQPPRFPANILDIIADEVQYLDEEFQEIYWLRSVGHEFREIASRLAETNGTVVSIGKVTGRWYRGLNQLRERLRQRCPDLFDVEPCEQETTSSTNRANSLSTRQE